MARLVTYRRPGDRPEDGVPLIVRNGQITNQVAYELPAHVQATNPAAIAAAAAAAAAAASAPASAPSASTTPAIAAPAPAVAPTTDSPASTAPTSAGLIPAAASQTNPSSASTIPAEEHPIGVRRSVRGKKNADASTKNPQDRTNQKTSAPAGPNKITAKKGKKRGATAAALSDTEGSNEPSSKPEVKRNRIDLGIEAWEKAAKDEKAPKGKKAASTRKTTTAKKGKSASSVPAPSKKASAKGNTKTTSNPKPKTNANASDATKSKGFKIWVGVYSLDLPNRAFKNMTRVQVTEQNLASMGDLFRAVSSKKRFTTHTGLGGKILFDKAHPKDTDKGACSIGTVDDLTHFVTTKRKEFSDGKLTYTNGAAAWNLSLVMCDKAEERHIRSILKKEGFWTV